MQAELEGISHFDWLLFCDGCPLHWSRGCVSCEMKSEHDIIYRVYTGRRLDRLDDTEWVVSSFSSHE